MANIIKNRSEILFLYEVENTNPNGDPLNENRPRYDSEESKVLVSDVRLKRTIRDYWYAYKGFNGQNGKDVFVREVPSDKGGLKDAKARAKDFQGDPNKVIEQCIDIRVFGGVIPMEKGTDSFTFTGPTQFQMGKSLNKAEVVEIQGTGAFASKEGKTQKTFRTEYVVPYAVIGFNGIINETAAQTTKMTEDDKALLLEGIWEGTKQLISRSKFGQLPLLLLVIDYKEPFYIGALRQKVKLVPKDGINELQLRKVDDYVLDFTDLLNELRSVKDKIAAITFQKDSRLKIVADGKQINEISLETL